jgi:glucose/arabinose dehydrogenase
VVHVESGKTFPISGVKHVGEGGLLGIALHPEFEKNHFVYLYQTTELDGALKNRVVRYEYQNDSLTFDRIIFENIPGARFHDGGRIAFGPDDMLYVTTGDAGNEDVAQDTSLLSGKILRVRDGGSIPSDNPFGNAIWSYGHRNPQGLAWDAEEQLWSTEHGRSGVVSGYDEINLIQKGGNYGWPDNQGDKAEKGTKAPTLHSTADVTWAPASAAFYGDSLFFGGLAGESLYEVVIENSEVKEFRTHFVGTFGRIRDVVVGPDSFLYITTSNRDGRGDPRDGDDKILKVDPRKL